MENNKDLSQDNKERPAKLAKKTIASLWVIIYSLNLIVYFLTSDKSLPILQVLFLNNVFYASIMTIFSYHAYTMLKSAGNIKQSLSGFIKTREDNPDKLTIGSVIKVSIMFFMAALFALSFITYVFLKALL